MILKTIRETIVKGLNEYTNLTVVNSDNEHKKPDYPYITFKITTIRQSEGARGEYSKDVIKSKDKNFEFDIKHNLEFQPFLILSVQICAKNLEDAQDYAIKAWEYFRLGGIYDFSDIDVVVVDQTDIQDRTVVIGPYYEYRAGFDVRIRYMHKISKTVGTIEEGKIRGKVNNIDFEDEFF